MGGVRQWGLGWGVLGVGWAWGALRVGGWSAGSVGGGGEEGEKTEAGIESHLGWGEPQKVGGHWDLGGVWGGFEV